MPEITQDHIDAAFMVARRHGRKYPQLRDEFESAAMVGLAKAAWKFSRAPGENFEAYAYFCVTSEIVATRWKWYGRDDNKTSRPLAFSIDASQGEFGPISDRIASRQDPVIDELHCRNEFAYFVSSLPDHVRDIFLANHEKDVTWVELAAQFGLSRAAIFRRLRVARDVATALFHVRDGGIVRKKLADTVESTPAPVPNRKKREKTP